MKKRVVAMFDVEYDEGQWTPSDIALALEMWAENRGQVWENATVWDSLDDFIFSTDNQQTETDMDKQLITISYYWNSDPHTPWESTAAIGEYDGESNDDDIFYWFAPGEEILGDHGEFTVTSASYICDSCDGFGDHGYDEEGKQYICHACGGAGYIPIRSTKEDDMFPITITEQDKMIAVPTGSAAALTDGLAIAIEALEEFYGSDESETLTHLQNILATHGVRKGD